MSPTRRVTGILGSALMLCGACGIISGVDKYEVVDCPSGNCSDGGNAQNQDGAPADAAGNLEAQAEAAASCPVGEVRVTIEVAPGLTVHVEFENLDVAPGEKKSRCAKPPGVAGGDLRAETNPNVFVKWAGVDCENSNTNTRCDFRPTTDVTITVSP